MMKNYALACFSPGHAPDSPRVVAGQRLSLACHPESLIGGSRTRKKERW